MQFRTRHVFRLPTAQARVGYVWLGIAFWYDYRQTL